MRVRILGRLEVLSDEGVGLDLGTPKQRTVLAMLLARANRLVTVEQLIDELWPDNPPASALANTRTYAANLRRQIRAAALSGLRLENRGTGYVLHVATDQFDALVFQCLLGQGRADAAKGDLVVAAERFDEALALWRGQAFEDVVVGPALAVRRAALCQEHAATVENCAEALLGLGRCETAAPLLREHVADHPTRERGWELLMKALHGTGDIAGALSAYTEARSALVESLGIEPSARLQELQQTVLRSGPTRPPRTMTSDKTSMSPRCLPRPIRDFTGRVELVARLVAQLSADDPPLIAIDGMPGAGKTTLAVHVATHVADRYPDGQLYLDLHGHSESTPVEPTTALGLLLGQLDIPRAHLPTALEARAARWRTELARRRLLILLDNAADSHQLAPLLPGTSPSAVLVTSRRRLAGLHDARHVSLDLLRPEEAVELLVRIVGDGAVVAHPEAADEVARLCGYLPLTLRIAGARLASRTSWTVRDLARRLRASEPPVVELSVEGNSVATAFSLSYRHLPTATQHMFRLVGLHPGIDFDEHAAAALADVPAATARDLLEQLVDVHLLEQPTMGRYRLHDLLRDYSRRLAEPADSAFSDEPALARLVDYYLSTSVNASTWLIRGMALERVDWGCYSPHAIGFPDHDAAMPWLDTEWRNSLAVARCAFDLGWYRRACLLSLVLWPSMFRRDHNENLIDLQEKLTLSTSALDDHYLLGLTHHCLAGSQSRIMRHGRAIHHLENALAIWRKLSDRRNESSSLNNYIVVFNHLGRFGEALEAGRRAVDLAEELGDGICLALAHHALGSTYRIVGDYGPALRHLRYAATTCLVLRDIRVFPNCLLQLGQVHYRLGHFTVAAALLSRAETTKRLAGNPFGAAEALSEVGVIHLRAGRVERALDCQQQALANGPTGGDPQIETLLHNNLAETLCAIGDLTRALEHGRTALRIAENADYPYEQARAHARIAAALVDDPAAAATHWEKALAMHTEMGTPERHEAAEQLRRLRESSGDEG